MPRVTITVAAADGSQHKFDLSYLVRGEGPRKVLLIMGLHTPGEAWDVNVEALLATDQSLQICTYDNRGCGHSDMPDVSRFTTQDMARDAEALLNHLGWNKSVHVVGISMGGMIAAELALSLPAERIASLTLAVTHMGGLGKVPPFEGGLQFVRGFFRTPQESALDLMHALFSDEFLARPPPPNSPPEQRTMLDHCLAKHLDRIRRYGMPKGQLHQIAAVATHSISDDRLSAIRTVGVATMVIGAGSDKLIRSSCSADIARVLGPQEFVDFPGCGHAVNFEKFHEFNSALLRHWQRNARDAPKEAPAKSE